MSDEKRQVEGGPFAAPDGLLPGAAEAVCVGPDGRPWADGPRPRVLVAGSFNPVHAGHWGETPEFGKTMNRWARFVRPDTPDDERRKLLRESGVRYLLFTQKHDETHDEVVEKSLLSLFRTHPPSYLRLLPEASNADADVYMVERLP